MSGFETDRRTLMGALAAVPVIAGSPAALAATSPKFSTLVAQYRAACGASERFDQEVEVPMAVAFKEACAKIPHYTTKTPFDLSNGPVHMSTESELFVGIARKIVARSPVSDHPDDLACRELVAAADRRDAEIAKLREQFGLDEARGRSDALGDASYEALVAIENFPVTSAPDLTTKIELIDETGGVLRPEVMIADIRRVFGEAKVARA